MYFVPLISRATENLYGDCAARGGQHTQGGWIKDTGELKPCFSPLILYCRVIPGSGAIKTQFVCHPMLGTDGLPFQALQHRLSNSVVTKGNVKI